MIVLTDSQLALLELRCNSENPYVPGTNRADDIHALHVMKYISKSWYEPNAWNATRSGRLALVEAQNAAAKEAENLARSKAESDKQARREYRHDWMLMIWTVLLTLFIEHLGDVWAFIQSLFIAK